MTFIEFKKRLLDIDLSIPKFCELLKISVKNVQSYKKKNEVPNSLAVAISCFCEMKNENINFKEIVEELNLEQKTKENAGFASKKKSIELIKDT